jgi:hypothetical protein
VVRNPYIFSSKINENSEFLDISKLWRLLVTGFVEWCSWRFFGGSIDTSKI